MRKILKFAGLVLLFLFVLSAIFSGSRVTAANIWGRPAGGAEGWLVELYRWSVIIGIWLSILMIILGGYRYMASQGNPESLGEAKEMIYGAIAGFILLLLTALIYNALTQ